MMAVWVYGLLWLLCAYILLSLALTYLVQEYSRKPVTDYVQRSAHVGEDLRKENFKIKLAPIISVR